MAEQQRPEYDFPEGFARCLTCGRTDFLHLPECPVVSHVCESGLGPDYPCGICGLSAWVHP
jgi:hypothetical protein